MKLSSKNLEVSLGRISAFFVACLDPLTQYFRLSMETEDAAAAVHRVGQMNER